MSNFGYSTAPAGYTTATRTSAPAQGVPVVHSNSYAGVPVQTTTHAYGLMGDPERRLNEASARQLARLVFMKYDDNDSGFINSQEAARLITDLYASCNMNYNATPEEGKEFMRANDSDKNWEFNRQDFEDFFVKHLSTQSNQVGFNLFTDSTATGALPSTYRPPVHATHNLSTLPLAHGTLPVTYSNVPAGARQVNPAGVPR